MAAVQEGPWKSLSSGKKVVLAAGLSVGATVGYILYRHIRSSGGEIFTCFDELTLVICYFRGVMVKLLHGSIL